jgi:hypothetical protein
MEQWQRHATVVVEVLPLPPLYRGGLLILPFTEASSSSYPPVWRSGGAGSGGD